MNDTGRRARGGRLLPILAALFLFGPALADEDPFFEQRGIDDRAAFFIGGLSSTVDTRAQIDPEFGVGSSLQLERIFNLPRERTYPRFQGYWRFSRKHRLNFQFLRYASSGSSILIDESIKVGDEVFEVNAEIGAEQKTRFAALEYRYSFVNNGRAEAGLSAGLGVIDTNLMIYGQVMAGTQTEIAMERVNVTIPLPVGGVFVDFTLTRRLFLSIEALLFSANYDKYSGNVDDSRVALRWYPSKIFGLGLAWNRTRIDLTIAEERGDLRLDYLFDGPSAFISFLLPGLT